MTFAIHIFPLHFVLYKSFRERCFLSIPSSVRSRDYHYYLYNFQITNCEIQLYSLFKIFFYLYKLNFFQKIFSPVVFSQFFFHSNFLVLPLIVCIFTRLYSNSSREATCVQQKVAVL